MDEWTGAPAAPLFGLSAECLSAGTATPRAEKDDRRAALPAAALFFSLPLPAALLLGAESLLALLPASVLAAAWHLRRRGALHRRRRELWRRPFPPEAEAFLLAEIPHFRRLDEPGRELFRQRAKIFLGEVAFHGAGIEVDDGLRLRAAAAAVVPTLGFPEWTWPGLGEIVFRPEGCEGGSVVDDGGIVTEFEESGMVGADGVLSGTMMLSADDLVWEFAHPGDGANVGFHEFAHVMADGGLALAECDRSGWDALLERERRLIRRGDSLLDDYALVDGNELFAVASELFFTVPRLFRGRHRDLYAVLARAYRQDPCRWLETTAPLSGGRRRRGRRRRGRTS